MMRHRFAAFLCFAIVLAAVQAHAEIKVETVRSNGGIEAWLVHDSTLPIIAINFAFKGGAAQDPEAKEGLALFMAGLLDEGAGPYDSRVFQQKLRTLAVSLSFDTAQDNISGSMRTLRENRDDAFELLRLALMQPRFDKDAVERVRGQIFSTQRNRANDNGKQADYAYAAAAYPNHPYGRRMIGTEGSIRSIARNDILSAHKRLLARGNLKIAVAGDISAEELAKALDSIFGALPEQPDLKPVADTKPQGQGRQIVIEQKGPQSFIQFGGIASKRHDDDFIASYVLNHILGGESFSARLYKEVREKRGYTYGIYTGIDTFDHAGAFSGSLAVRNEVAGAALKVIEDELAKIARDGPSEEELEGAKTYLIGSYPLHFDTTSKIAGMLISLLNDDMPVSYVAEREKLFRAVTLDDVRRAAQKMFHDPPLVVVVGAPKDIEAK